MRYRLFVLSVTVLSGTCAFARAQEQLPDAPVPEQSLLQPVEVESAAPARVDAGEGQFEHHSCPPAKPPRPGFGFFRWKWRTHWKPWLQDTHWGYPEHFHERPFGTLERGYMQTQVLSGHLPALFHPDPGTALVVGLASGVTAGSLATHPLERIDVVEIEAAVVEASRYFDGVNNRPLEDPRVRAVVNDGRNYLLFTDQRYDIIISEPSNPWLTGAANLFTLEYFDLTARRLAPGGISCQWIQAYNMTLPDLQSLLATYASVFEHVLLFNLDGSDLLLLGSQRPLRFDTDALARRMSLLDVAIDLGRVRIRAVEDLLAWFSLGEVEIEGLARGAGLNTDDNARVEFAAPWSLFQETLAANTRALEAWRAAPEAYLDPKPGTAQDRAGFHRRLAAALLRRGAVEAALEQVERALALQPDDATRRLEEQIRDHLDG